ncbi:hypothetical protein A1Q1_07483 [Trichosporon asahii var. asahii CBS 2479]|uniref:Uncharacterized protein n=1 Tax=Trichosporon asahii var. asahii (strain ATCC 90039 / CBS 2479 / JCM 2466 / KCTC 7840 / NBRC 103889/ NCYC 2677 / UAMH 7654) TaxID=1186058 RepID=J6F7H4_TRIAS|nr:hypothetical protein A1Q1_07483 [Trichosporon asahii var. asahii CBS 2479]EJT51302.1 hypothetical protein A1Q1_07483 [Trichosporon asahii var. asahii CBS 2479]
MAIHAAGNTYSPQQLTSRKCVPKQQAGRNRKDWEDVESFLRGQLPGFQWEQALPEPSIHRVVSGFSHRNTKFVDLIVPKLKTVEVQQRLKKLIKKVRRRRSKAPELVTNNDNVCTLSFAATTSTRDIARLVAVVILRYLYFCGRMWVVTMRDFGSAWLDPVAVYLHLVEAVLEQNYVRFFDDDGKTTLLGTVDLISGLPLTHGSLAGSSGKVTYLAHEQHGLRASLFRGDETDDDLYGNHGHEAFAVNVTRGSWRYPTLVAHIRSRQEPLQKLADSLAKVGILPKVTLPEFQPSKQMRELWMNNRVDPLEAVSRDPALPERLCRGLEAARREVKELADARRRQQAEAAEQANANGRRLMSGACDTCATALRMDGICASCKSDARRLDRYAERASSRQSVRPGLSGQVNVGFGIGNQAQGGSGYRLLEGLCLYPDCDTTYNVWRPWPGRKKAGRVCARHNASLRRDTNDCTRLTAVLDEILRSLPHRSATPLLLKREIAKLVDTRDITARARSGTRRYNKRPTNPKIDKTRRSAWPVPAASPDKRHQIDAEGPARHSTGNTDRTNCIHNSAKFAMLETSRDITDLAIFMTEMIPDVDVSGLAALRNKFSNRAINALGSPTARPPSSAPSTPSQASRTTTAAEQGVLAGPRPWRTGTTGIPQLDPAAAAARAAVPRAATPLAAHAEPALAGELGIPQLDPAAAAARAAVPRAAGHVAAPATLGAPARLASPAVLPVNFQEPGSHIDNPIVIDVADFGQFADVLAKVGVIEPVKLPEFEPFERIKALWKHNAVHPVEAVARDLGLPGRYEDGLKKARTEVMLQALNRGRKQAVADDVAVYLQLWEHRVISVVPRRRLQLGRAIVCELPPKEAKGGFRESYQEDPWLPRRPLASARIPSARRHTTSGTGSTGSAALCASVIGTTARSAVIKKSDRVSPTLWTTFSPTLMGSSD